MASPVDAGRINTNISTASDPWTINLPSSIAAGDLLIVYVRSSAGGSTTQAGWTFLVDSDQSDASDDFTVVAYKKADGSETSTMSWDMASSVKGAAIAYRITGAADPTSLPPEVGTIATGTGANCDPGVVTPTSGSKDYLFLAMAGLDGETQTFTAPANYGNLQQANSGTGGAAATNVRIASASRQLTASSEDPGVFTNGAPSNGWSAWTVAVYPASAFIEAPKIDVQQAVKRSSYY